jgi:hypothetical protein
MGEFFLVAGVLAAVIVFARAAARRTASPPPLPQPRPSAPDTISRKPSGAVLRYVAQHHAESASPTTAKLPSKPARKRRESVRRSRPATNRGRLHFVYEDAEGNQSIRTVTRWREEDEYVIGWCQDAHDERTFRKDRVLEWIDGSDALLDDPYG